MLLLQELQCATGLVLQKSLHRNKEIVNDRDQGIADRAPTRIVMDTGKVREIRDDPPDALRNLREIRIAHCIVVDAKDLGLERKFVSCRRWCTLMDCMLRHEMFQLSREIIDSRFELCGAIHAMRGWS